MLVENRKQLSFAICMHFNSFAVTSYVIYITMWRVLERQRGHPREWFVGSKVASSTSPRTSLHGSVFGLARGENYKFLNKA